jgi:hypothetical protein
MRPFRPMSLLSWRSLSAIATNEPVSSWPNTFTDPRLCAAIVDRLSFDGHIEVFSSDWPLEVE